MKKLIFACVVFVIGLTSWTLGQSSPSTSWGDAMWVWDEADASKIPQNNEPRYLRMTFDIPATPQAAELWVTADNLYTAYVNGVKVGDGKEWSQVDKYTVVKHLVVGKNVLAIRATNQGGVAAAIARLHIKTADKKDLFVVTNEKTKITSKFQLDGGNGNRPWFDAQFDDSSWFAAIALGDPSIAPWNLGGGAIVKGKGKGKAGDRFGYGSTAVDPKVTKRLSAEEQKKHFIVPKDFEIELVAADPVVINPITMVLDDKGRIIVSESHTYRYGPPGSPIKPYANPVIRLDPDGKGGFTRTLIADGFTDPVMGIAIKGNKLWLTACDYLYTYDLPADGEKKGAFLPSSPGTPGREGSLVLAKKKGTPQAPTESKGIATNKKLLLKDHSKAWNPFGMFVLEWGPDGKLYMSVGNHNINIEGPDGQKISAKGSSGMIMRMNPDGTKMERLVHGLRVPYSFEMDPFGQLWLLSNGEGNPNRFVRVIDGVDYHCYSRGVDNEWLAGRHPLAPPSEEVHDGAHTQFMRYYAANFPQEYQGNLFACNWGRHGFAGANRGIFRFVLDDRNNIVKKETLVTCADPHFRPAHIHLDVDGSLLIADWYGRDDESDMTGRIWRLKYVGKDRPVVKHSLDSPDWKNDDYAIEALGSPDHLIRAKAMDELVKRGDATSRKVALHSRTAKAPLGAANALWVLARTHSTFDLNEDQHPDWKVRRLAHELAPLQFVPGGGQVNKEKRNIETDPAVLLARAMRVARFRSELKEDPILSTVGFFGVLESGGAADPHLRYEAAWHLAKNAHEKTIGKLLESDDANVGLAGLIAIDVACYENTPAKKAALAALAKAIENPGKLDHQLLLTVAQLDGDASIVPALVKLVERDDLPAATIAKAVLVLKAKSGGTLAASKLSSAAGKRLIEAVEKGSLKIASPADQLVMFEFLEAEGPTPFALKQVGSQLQSNNKELRLAAHTLARRFGPKASSVADQLWPVVFHPKTKFEDTLEYLSTIARTETKPVFEDRWSKGMFHADPFIRAETVRWWRIFKDNRDMQPRLSHNVESLTFKDKTIRDDIGAVYASWGAPEKDANVPYPEKDKEKLTKYAVEELATMPAADRTRRAAMGLQVFERNACTKCHTTATTTTLLAPSLKGVAQQKTEYLIESVLYPSKIIKTGWEVETIELKNGKVITGLVKDEGKTLRLIQAMDYLGKPLVIDKADIDARSVSKISLMPDGQEATLSRREFVDLIAYLQTLK